MVLTPLPVLVCPLSQSTSGSLVVLHPTMSSQPISITVTGVGGPHSISVLECPLSQSASRSLLLVVLAQPESYNVLSANQHHGHWWSSLNPSPRMSSQPISIMVTGGPPSYNVLSANQHQGHWWSSIPALECPVSQSASGSLELVVLTQPES